MARFSSGLSVEKRSEYSLVTPNFSLCWFFLHLKLVSIFVMCEVKNRLVGSLFIELFYMVKSKSYL
jgi:hypothetical protein